MARTPTFLQPGQSPAPRRALAGSTPWNSTHRSTGSARRPTLLTGTRSPPATSGSTSWTAPNIGTAAGSACPYTAGGTNCKIYQVDADAHFLPGDEEYQWLAADLQAHPGGIKLAFFHFPL